MLQQALGVDGAWLALVHGHKGVRLYAAVGSLCAAGEVHAWQNSLSLWTCSPATHRVLAIDDTTLDARRVPCTRASKQKSPAGRLRLIDGSDVLGCCGKFTTLKSGEEDASKLSPYAS